MRTFKGALAVALLCAHVCAQASTFIVNVGGGGNVFNPQTISIHPDDTVVFINKGGYHNVVADDGSFRCAHGCDGDGHGGNGSASSSTWVVSLSFDRPGTIGYFCEIHGAPGEGMYGTINVAAPPPPAPLSAAPVNGWKFGALLACGLVFAAGARLRARRPRR